MRKAALLFEGLCPFADPPKASAPAAVALLAAAGVRVVILSGDDPLVANVAQALWNGTLSLDHILAYKAI